MTDDLDQLKGHLKSINEKHSHVESKLKLKLKQIKKLDVLQKDLDKLKYLNELPEMLKEAINTYERTKKDLQRPTGASQPSGESDDCSKIIDVKQVFGQTLQIYQDYSGVLIVHKKTKFMHDLYQDIKQHIQKVKVILT